MNHLIERQKAGFTYTIEVERNGVVINRETVHNLMPTEGLNYLLGAAFKGAAQASNWYIAPYEGNYTPNGSETAATVAALTTECTAYDEATRVAFVSGAVSSGSIDNSASRAEFTINATKTIRGGYLISGAAKGATSGVLASIVRFASPKSLEDGDIFRVLAGNALESA